MAVELYRHRALINEKARQRNPGCWSRSSRCCRQPEVVWIKPPQPEIDFYDDEQTYLESRILQTGDVILLAYVVHGFEMLEPTEMIEVKQGPYAGEQEKTRFERISADQPVFMS